MQRVTITEIARRAGVSKGAVSFALNGRPGVSDATRARILAIARELDWTPNSAARMLSGSRTDTIGLLLARTPATPGIEPFFVEFISGLESVLGPRGYGLLLQVVTDPVAEVAAYRRWAAQRRVDGVVVVDVRLQDPRPSLLLELGMPAVVAGDPSFAGEGTASAWTDDAAASEAVVRHLAGLGHTRVGRAGGPAHVAHVRIRDAAFAAAATATGVRLSTSHTDFGGDGGARATRALLDAPDPPTALVYDSDLMAVAGLAVAAERGIDVPGELTLVAWDDSELCRATHPTLTAMGHDVTAYGAEVARVLFGRLAGEPAAAHLAATPSLRPRGSSGPPPG